jgi:hypothetical protein
MNMLPSVSRTLFAYVGVACIGFVQPAAAQQSCKGDADCLKGFVCETNTMPCAVSAPCRDGEKCPDAVACEPAEYSQCVSGPCTRDADCADGMVCLTQSSQVCSGAAPVACIKGQECVAPEPAQCSTVTESECVPKYQAPCVQDADCGEGFTCVQGQECWCSGSAGVRDSGQANGAASGSGTGGKAGSADTAAAADAGAPDSPTSSDCGCKPSGTFHCDMQDITCDTNANCPSGWTCEESRTNAVDIACGGLLLADGGVTTVCADAGPTEPAPKQCMPPYYNTYGVSRGNDSTVGTASKGETQSPVSNANNAGSTGTGATASEDAHGDRVVELGETSCQVALGHTGPTTAWAVLASLLSLLGLRRRRAS